MDEGDVHDPRSMTYQRGMTDLSKTGTMQWDGECRKYALDSFSDLTPAQRRISWTIWGWVISYICYVFRPKKSISAVKTIKKCPGSCTAKALNEHFLRFWAFLACLLTKNVSIGIRTTLGTTIYHQDARKRNTNRYFDTASIEHKMMIFPDLCWFSSRFLVLSSKKIDKQNIIWFNKYKTIVWPLSLYFARLKVSVMCNYFSAIVNFATCNESI